jgi:hypothetical protein
MRLSLCLVTLLASACATTSETTMVECKPGECTPKTGEAVWSPDEAALRKRAAFDLHCDAAKLSLTPFDSRTYGLEGCGRRATYSNSCMDRDRSDPGDVGYCTWVQTGTQTATEVPAAATTK